MVVIVPGSQLSLLPEYYMQCFALLFHVFRSISISVSNVDLQTCFPGGPLPTFIRYFSRACNWVWKLCGIPNWQACMEAPYSEGLSRNAVGHSCNCQVLNLTTCACLTTEATYCIHIQTCGRTTNLWHLTGKGSMFIVGFVFLTVTSEKCTMWPTSPHFTNIYLVWLDVKWPDIIWTANIPALRFMCWMCFVRIDLKLNTKRVRL